MTLHPRLPAPLQTQLAIRAWTRAAALEQWSVARAVAPIVAAALPALQAELTRLGTLKDAKAQQRIAAMIMLREPRLFPAFEHEACGAGKEGVMADRARLFSCAFPLLKNKDRQAAVGEEEALCQRQPWANYFCRIALDWAKDRPEDPLAPEALHRAVQGTRRASIYMYGATNDQTGDFSRRCFEVLHQRYPKSPWTAKTKYWYK